MVKSIHSRYDLADISWYQKRKNENAASYYFACRKQETTLKIELEITIDLEKLESPVKRKRKRKKVEIESETPDADEYAYNDKIWNTDVTPGYYKGK